jgi:succinyl-diaminopimelate desuccinylase
MRDEFGDLLASCIEWEVIMNQLVKVNKLLDDFYVEMETRLLELLAIPSVQGEAAPGAPFGLGPDKALQYCLDLAKQMGFTITNFDGYMGIVDLPGQINEQVGILSHVDVVPAVPEDWKYHPFQPVVDDGLIYGRGVIDNKGPLIACLYAMLAIREAGCTIKRTVRHLLGTNEETGMGCMDYFVKNYPQMPAYGFVPDARFPAIIGEKGLARWTFSADWDAAIDGSIRLNKITGGTGINSVPPLATASFAVTESGWNLIHSAYKGLPLDLRKDILVKRDGNIVNITANGIAAHASLPEKGDNAITKLLKLVTAFTFEPAGAYRFVNDVTNMFLDWRGGTTLGIADSDEYSVLTNLLSLINILPEGGSFSCDTRFPVTRKAEDLKVKLEQIATAHQMHLTWWYQMEQMFISDNTPLVEKLVKVFQDESGDMTPPMVIGSGTYARMLPGFVAYGPLFPEDENITHQANERMSQEKLLRLTKIYAKAICELVNM